MMTAPTCLIDAILRHAGIYVCTCLIACLLTSCTPQGSTNDMRNQNGPLAEGAMDAEDLSRTIEEADIVKHVDNYLYVVNRWEGLKIIDLTNIDTATLVGELSFEGLPVEMYVMDGRAYLVMHNYSYDEPIIAQDAAPRPDIATATAMIYPSGQAKDSLMVINVADPAAPSLADTIEMDGYITSTRRVGDILYLAGQDNAEDWRDIRPHEAADAPYLHMGVAFVASVSVADPDNVQLVDRRTFEGAASQMHVTDHSIYLTSPGSQSTILQYIDISDPAGAINVRGSVEVPGYISNRFYLDEYDNALRVVTDDFESAEGGWWRRIVRLYTYDVTDPDNIAALTNLDIVGGESLMAVRFDGTRGYVVTFEIIDPLFVIDLADASAPVVTGELEVPGFSTHIEPRGDTLFAIGRDDTDGDRPAVVLYDVSDPTNPTQVTRVVLGESGDYTGSEAVYDEKAWKVLDDAQLVLVPYYEFGYDDQVLYDTDDEEDNNTDDQEDSYGGPRYYLQLVDFSSGELVARGRIQHKGEVRRSDVVQPDRLWALSDTTFGVYDISDLDNIVEVTSLAVAEAPQWYGYPYYGGYPYGNEVGMGAPPCGPLGVETLALGMTLLSLNIVAYRRRL